jgi:hypothetical protein
MASSGPNSNIAAIGLKFGLPPNFGELRQKIGYGDETASEVSVRSQMLPFDERIKLVEDLWDSIASDQQALVVASTWVG